MRDNTEVTYMRKGNNIEVTFEKGLRNGGFATLVTDISGNIISNIGFSEADVGYFLRFLKTNAYLIKKWEAEYDKAI
jgi:hypothetical protein